MANRFNKLTPPELVSIRRWVNEKAGEETLREEKERAVALVPVVMFEYFQYWYGDDKDKKWISFEQQQAVRHDLDIPLLFTIDGAFNDGETRLKDTKTFGREYKGQEDLMLFDLQFNMYLHCFYLKTGVVPSSLIKDQIRNPGQKLGVKESLVDLAARVHRDIKKRPEHYFMRFEAEYPDSQEIVDWGEQQLRPMLFELLLWFDGQAPHYINPRALSFNSVVSPYLYFMLHGSDPALRKGSYWNRYHDLARSV